MYKKAHKGEEASDAVEEEREAELVVVAHADDDVPQEETHCSGNGVVRHGRVRGEGVALEEGVEEKSVESAHQYGEAEEEGHHPTAPLEAVGGWQVELGVEEEAQHPPGALMNQRPQHRRHEDRNRVHRGQVVASPLPVGQNGLPVEPIYHCRHIELLVRAVESLVLCCGFYTCKGHAGAKKGDRSAKR